VLGGGSRCQSAPGPLGAVVGMLMVGAFGALRRRRA
jgi:MYXO-CTERM domain-containing protein